MSEQVKRLTDEQREDWERLVRVSRAEIADVAGHHGPGCRHCRENGAIVAIDEELDALRADVAAITVHDGPACHMTHYAGCACHEASHRQENAILQAWQHDAAERVERAEAEMETLRLLVSTETPIAALDLVATWRIEKQAFMDEVESERGRRLAAERKRDELAERVDRLANGLAREVQKRMDAEQSLVAERAAPRRADGYAALEAEFEAEREKRLAAERERDEARRLVSTETPIVALDLTTTWRAEKQVLQDEVEVERARVARLREVLTGADEGIGLLVGCFRDLLESQCAPWAEDYDIPVMGRNVQKYISAALAEISEPGGVEMVTTRYRRALEEIKRDCGRVCEEFETCKHPACRSSYAAWQIADSALAEIADLGSEAKGDGDD